jgi:hypothetical protein
MDKPIFATGSSFLSCLRPWCLIKVDLSRETHRSLPLYFLQVREYMLKLDSFPSTSQPSPFRKSRISREPTPAQRVYICSTRRIAKRAKQRKPNQTQELPNHVVPKAE